MHNPRLQRTSLRDAAEPQTVGLIGNTNMRHGRLFLTVLAVAAWAREPSPAEQIDALISAGSYHEAVVTANELLAQLPKSGSVSKRQPIVRQIALAYVLDGEQRAGIDAIFAAFGHEKVALETFRLIEVLLKNRASTEASGIAEYAQATWPAHEEAFRAARQRATNDPFFQGSSSHGAIVRQAWGYPQGGYCSYMEEYEDGYVAVYKVPSR